METSKDFQFFPGHSEPVVSRHMKCESGSWWKRVSIYRFWSSITLTTSTMKRCLKWVRENRWFTVSSFNSPLPANLSQIQTLLSTRAYSHSYAKRNWFISASAIARFEHYISIKMSFENLFSSFRPVYISIEKDDKNAKAILAEAIQNDAVAYGQSIDILLEPPSSQIIRNIIDWSANDLLGVMIRLPSPDPAVNLIPIGHLSLSAYDHKRQYRSCTLSIKGLWHRGHQLGSRMGFQDRGDAFSVSLGKFFWHMRWALMAVTS